MAIGMAPQNATGTGAFIDGISFSLFPAGRMKKIKLFATCAHKILP